MRKPTITITPPLSDIFNVGAWVENQIKTIIHDLKPLSNKDKKINYLKSFIKTNIEAGKFKEIIRDEVIALSINTFYYKNYMHQYAHESGEQREVVIDRMKHADSGMKKAKSVFKYFQNIKSTIPDDMRKTPIIDLLFFVSGELERLGILPTVETDTGEVFTQMVIDRMNELVEKNVIKKKNGVPNFPTTIQALDFFDKAHKDYDIPGYANKYAKIISENIFINGKKLKAESIRKAKNRLKHKP